MRDDVCVDANGQLVCLNVPDLGPRGYALTGAGLLVLTEGFQDPDPSRPNKGLGKTHIEFRHGKNLQAANCQNAEEYFAALVKMPFRLYDLADRRRILLYRPVVPIGGLIFGPATDQQRLRIEPQLAAQQIGVPAQIYVVVSAFAKRTFEGQEIWVQRR